MGNPVKLLISPRYTAIMHGFIRTFLNAPLLSPELVKIEIPAVHIKIRFGIIKIVARSMASSPSTEFTIGSPRKAELFTSVAY